MKEGIVVGVNPLLPRPLCNWAWWTEPVRAERLAALRIGLGAVLLLDVLGFYLPFARDFFGADSLGGPEFRLWQVSPPFVGDVPWSALAWVPSSTVWQVILLLWSGLAVMLVLGVCPRLAAAGAWFIGGCVHYVNPFLFNSGDAVRGILLFYLMLCPCGAVWALSP